MAAVVKLCGTDARGAPAELLCDKSSLWVEIHQVCPKGSSIPHAVAVELVCHRPLDLGFPRPPPYLRGPPDRPGSPAGPHSHVLIRLRARHKIFGQIRRAWVATLGGGGTLILKVIAILVIASMLEVGGIALIRIGLSGSSYLLFAGAASLFGYGLVVNKSGLDFNRLMGIYIAIFFLVSQLISLVMFKEVPDDRLILGGGFIIAGGLLILLMS
jgi:hypothetical protein